MKNQTKTLRAFEMLKRMRSDIYITIQAYWLWHEIIKWHQSFDSKNPDNSDSKILCNYFAFFQPIERGLWDSFVIGLCKPFDKNERYPILNIKK